MRHAGAVADLYFHRKVEAKILPDASKLGLCKYLRFRDDLLAVVSDICHAPIFFTTIREKAASYCTIGQDAYSLRAVPFLDLMIFKSAPEGEGFLSWRPFVKPTARHIPLSSESYHPASVHKSWPQAEMLRMTRRSADAATAASWRQAKLDRFKHFMLRPRVLQECAVWRARTEACSAKEWMTVQSVFDRRCLIRLVLPYRHELVALPAELKAIVRLYRERFLFETGLDLELCVCWSKAGAALGNLVRGRMEWRR